MENRDFKGVWIPKEIWLNKELSALDKVLLAEISSLDNENHCFASNDYFAEFCGVGIATITRSIKKLKDLGYIECETVKTKTGTQRLIKMITRGSNQNDERGLINLSTNYNNTNNTNILSKDNISRDEQEPAQFEFGKPKSSKPNLYQNCLAQINAYTEDMKLRNSLHNYLDLCMEMKSIRCANQWKGMLNTLDRVYEESNKGDEKHGYGEIIQQSIDHGWKTFYSIKPFTNNQASGISKNVLPLKGGTKYENEDKSFIEGVEF